MKTLNQIFLIGDKSEIQEKVVTIVSKRISFGVNKHMSFFFLKKKKANKDFLNILRKLLMLERKRYCCF